jgi:hypothetical protein
MSKLRRIAFYGCFLFAAVASSAPPATINRGGERGIETTKDYRSFAPPSSSAPEDHFEYINYNDGDAGDDNANLFESDMNASYEPDDGFVGSQMMNVQHADDQQAMDYFSFAGQSNSIGHTTSDRSISKNGTYWNDLMRLFNESEYIGTSQAWSQRLYHTIQAVHTSVTGPGGVIAFLRDEAVRLQGMRLLDGLNRSLSLGR